jgi:hypothetical protein
MSSLARAPEIPEQMPDPETEDEAAANTEAIEAFGAAPTAEERAATAERQLRIMEALLFASAEPLAPSAFAPYLGEGADVDGLLTQLSERYAGRGVTLVRRGDKWAFRTADDLGFLLRREQRRRATSAVPRSRPFRSSPTTSPRPVPRSRRSGALRPARGRSTH